MGEPATEMDLMDSAKASRGLDLGLKNAIDERTPSWLFLTGRDLLHWQQVI